MIITFNVGVIPQDPYTPDNVLVMGRPSRGSAPVIVIVGPPAAVPVHLHQYPGKVS